MPVRPRCAPVVLFLASCGLCLWSATPSRAAGLLIAEGGLGGVLEVEQHIVNVTINNGIAVTEVEQIFRNTENRIVEALYMFPVPKGASVANFSMWINGREMVGEVVEKERARQIYESYKERNIDPGLLEQVDYKTFQMKIFPIAAHAEQRVRISYYQQLQFDDDRATYVYPLATSAKGTDRQRTTGRFALTLRTLSEVPIVEMDSPSHPEDFVLVKHSEQHHEASLENDRGDLSRDIVVSYRTSRAQTGLDLITSRPKGEDGFFMLTLTAGEELSALDEPMDYVFVIDISGSMAHAGKLSLSRNSVEAFVEALGPRDRFEIMTFNVRPTALFGKLESATPQAMGTATEFLVSQQARGGTVLRPAIQTAYRYGDPDRPLNVVILSDGMTEQRERTELIQLIHDRPENATVFAIGVGNEVNRPLLAQLAEQAGGLAAFISRGDDFQRQAQAFRRKLTRPAASQVALQIDGVDAYDVVPAKLPNLYHGAPVRVFGRFRGREDFQVRLDAEVRGKPFTQSDTLPPGDGKNPEIERMWASKRISELLRSADAAGNRQAVIHEIVDLGEAYSIVTEYTSLIVLENDDEYRRWKINRRNALRIDRDRERRAELQATLQRLRDKSLDQIGPVHAADAIDSKANKTTPTSQATGKPQAETPEPASLLLLILGGAPLLLMRRRRARTTPHH